MRQTDKCLDSQLWHACAGGMVQMPAVNSKVYYFPQGHAEHSQVPLDFGTSHRIPPLILCRVAAVKFMADSETDEVFSKILMIPLRHNESDYGENEEGLGLRVNGVDSQEKPSSFVKTLTKSDANNGGGFSVPRYCAETIFPTLDYSADPPVQTLLVKDVHGEIWKFRHIYRGTPRRHLLTTGWSTFVNQKKLVAGDSVVFLRTENWDLCVGIRRAKRGGIGGGPEIPSGWNPLNGSYTSSYGGFSFFLREEDNSKLSRGTGNGGCFGSGGGMMMTRRVRQESINEAAALAANGQPFEVVYYPRVSTPEFCVKAVSVKGAMRIQWCPGMRFKMAFETEDSSRISWFMGSISSVQVADPIRWPSSPWRLLQVTWDEPDLLENVNRVNPWLVELVSHISAVHLGGAFPPPRKKFRFPQNPDFPLEGKLPTPMFSRNPLGYSTSPMFRFPDGVPAAIQGARHAQVGVSLPDRHLNKLQSSLFHPDLHLIDPATSLSRISSNIIVDAPGVSLPDRYLNKLQSGLFHPYLHLIDPATSLSRISTNIIVDTPADNISSLPAIGTNSQSSKSSCNGKPPQLVLFGKPILTEEQISQSNSGDIVSAGARANSYSDGNLEKITNMSDESGYPTSKNLVFDNSSRDGSKWYRDRDASDLGRATGQCKVFMDSDDVGRTLDLTMFGSYQELYGRLADMFGIEKSEMMSHVIYKDAAGAVKHTGHEPFCDFMKTARRLTILVDSGSENIGRFVLPESFKANLQCVAVD